MTLSRICPVLDGLHGPLRWRSIASTCGGSRARPWSVSRESLPKRFIPPVEDLSKFQVTVRRSARAAFARPIVFANRDVHFIVTEQLRAVGVEAELALEPMRRDSAAAVALSVLRPSAAGPTGLPPCRRPTT